MHFNPMIYILNMILIVATSQKVFSQQPAPTPDISLPSSHPTNVAAGVVSDHPDEPEGVDWPGDTFRLYALGASHKINEMLIVFRASFDSIGVLVQSDIITNHWRFDSSRERQGAYLRETGAISFANNIWCWRTNMQEAPDHPDNVVGYIWAAGVVRHEYVHCAQQADSESRRLDSLPRTPPPSTPSDPCNTQRQNLYAAAQALQKYIKSVDQLEAYYYQARLVKRRVGVVQFLPPQDSAERAKIRKGLCGIYNGFRPLLDDEQDDADGLLADICSKINGTSEACPITLSNGMMFTRSDLIRIKSKTQKRFDQFSLCAEGEFEALKAVINSIPN